MGIRECMSAFRDRTNAEAVVCVLRLKLLHFVQFVFCPLLKVQVGSKALALSDSAIAVVPDLFLTDYPF